MKQFTLLLFLTFGISAQNNIDHITLAEKIKNDLVENISTIVEKEARQVLNHKNELNQIRANQKIGLELLNNDLFDKNTKYSLLKDITKNREDKIELYFQAIEEGNIEPPYIDNLIIEIPANETNIKRLTKLKELQSLDSESRLKLSVEIYKKLAKSDLNYALKFFESTLQLDSYYYDHDGKTIIMNAYNEGILKFNKDRQWAILNLLVANSISSGNCKLSHELLQKIFKHEFKSKQPYDDRQKIFDTFYPMWANQ